MSRTGSQKRTRVRFCDKIQNKLKFDTAFFGEMIYNRVVGGTSMTITENEKIIIERGKKNKSIEELFSDFHGEYTPVKIDWGVPVRKEVW